MATHNMRDHKNTLRSSKEGGRLDPRALRRRMRTLDNLPADEESDDSVADYATGADWALVVAVLIAEGNTRQYELKGTAFTDNETGETEHTTKAAIFEMIDDVDDEIEELIEKGNPPKSKVADLRSEKNALWRKADIIMDMGKKCRAEKLREQLTETGYLEPDMSDRERRRQTKKLTKRVKGIIYGMLTEAGAGTKDLDRGGTGIDFDTITLDHYANAISQAKARRDKADIKEEQHETKSFVVENDFGESKAFSTRDTHEEIEDFEDEAPGAAIDAAGEATDLDLERAAKGLVELKKHMGVDPRTPDEILAAGAKAKEEWREEQERKERKALIDGAMSRLAKVEAEEKAAQAAI